MHRKVRISFVSSALPLLLAATQAGAVTINFENLTEGTTLGNQYAAQGVVFTPNAFSGAGGPTGAWSSNTDMTVTAIDLDTLGTPTPVGPATLVSGKMLRAYSAWADTEVGDPSFRISFSQPLSSFSADFASVAFGSDVHVFPYNGTTLLTTLTGPTVTTIPSQFTLSYATLGLPITSVIITPGSVFDWVAVDNIVYTPVPELGTYAMMMLGLGLLAVRRRRG